MRACHINYTENGAPELVSREQESPVPPHIQASQALLYTHPSTSLASHDLWKSSFLSFKQGSFPSISESEAYSSMPS